ncbi:MAG: peptidylprolyl isomerase [Candidatus Cyclobacteriaceae bacterium M2_1C_046]
MATINGDPVTAGEFIYSFKKSHQNNNDTITAEDINEYLRLFVNYKLKVEEARANKYDTVRTYQDELSHYQEQVRSSYRATEKIIDTLVNEAYGRMQYEIDASHILLRVDKDASPEDTLEVYNRITEIRVMDKDFEALAQEFSEDPSASKNKGRLGYFSVFQMVYPFESAAYNTEEGNISMPFRSQYGYHLVKVHEKRPMVQMSLHHIMMPKNQQDDAKSSAKIFEAHEMLTSGMAPEQLLGSSFAIDNKITHKLIKPTEVNQLPAEFRSSFESLEEKGDVSDPYSTKEAWHIFVVEEKIVLPPLEEIKEQLERMVKRTDRLQLFKEQYTKDLLKKYNYIQHILPEDLKKVASSEENSDLTIFTLAGKAYMLKDFLNLFEGRDISSISDNEIKNRYKIFVENKVTTLEDKALMNSNEELRWLLKEYEEGMLLFAIMEDTIWNKAVQDTLGLRNFIADQHPEINNKDEKALDNKGRFIAGYQEYLEQKWVRKLREEYEVKINQKVLEQVYDALIK